MRGKMVLVCFLASLSISYGQNPFFGLPFLENYTPQVYQAEPVNWFVAQSPDGLLYVANNHCLLQYDGVHWKRIEIPLGICRSVAVDSKNQVFVGLQGDFGVLKPDTVGNLFYFSLKQEIPTEEQDFSDIWKTFVVDQEVFFCTRKKIFSKTDQTYRFFPAPKGFNYFFSTGKALYADDDSLGLVRIEKGQFSLVPNGNFYKGKKIRGVLESAQNQLLILTLEGFFLHDSQGNIRPFLTEIDQFIRENLPFDAVKLTSGDIAVATFRAGVVIINPQGKVLQIVNENTGLQNNSVRNMWLDRQHGLWLALNSGISRLEIHSAWQVYSQYLGLKGNIQQTVKLGETNYVGTSLGVFEQLATDWQNPQNTFRAVAGFSDQTWHLLTHQNTLWVSSNEGIFVRKGEKFVKIHQEGAFVLLPSAEGLLWAGLRNGVQIFENKGDKLALKYDLKSINAEIRTLVQDTEGVFWAGSKTNGLFKISFKNGKADVEKIKIDKQKRGNENIMVFSSSQGVLYSTPQGIYQYKNSVFERLAIEVSTLTNEKETLYLCEDTQKGDFWLWAGRKMALAKQNGRNYDVLEKDFKRLPNDIIHQIVPTNDQVQIATSHALYQYDRQNKAANKNNFQAFIRQISLIKTDTKVFSGTSQKSLLVFPYEQNSLRFEFASNFLEKPTANQYQYRLEGYDQDWSNWTSETHKEYTNLYEGEYTLLLRSQNIYGQISENQAISFRIKAPYYRTLLAYLFYAFSLLSIFYVGTKFYTYRLEKTNERLEKTVQARTAEIFLQKEELKAQRDNLEMMNAEILQQKEEIESQKDHLQNLNGELSEQKNSLAKSYENVQVISEMGQEITALLSVDSIVDCLYTMINRLMDARIFAVGLVEGKVIEFSGIESEEKILLKGTDSLDDPYSLSVACFQRQEVIWINDWQAECSQNERINRRTDLEHQSLVYLPLSLKNKKMGVITVQSLQKNAYTDYHKSILETLAIYIAIAIDNARAYKIIEDTHRSITDSIRYAKTIQTAILPTNAEFEVWFQDFFVIYRPKDVVSGDFYWLSTTEKTGLIIALADCTGHGVPGGFMSMIGFELLNEIVNEKKIYQLAEILSAMQVGLAKMFRQSDNSNGMDMVLLRIERADEQNYQLFFAGAKRPVYYIDPENKALNEIQGDRISLGNFWKEKLNFTEHSIFCPIGTKVYLFSDGYFDQANPDRKSIGSKSLKQFLLKNSHENMATQKQFLEEYLENHQQNTPQRDDISVIGFRLD